MNFQTYLFVGLALTGFACEAAAGSLTVQTTVVGPFTGHDAKLHPDNVSPQQIDYYGTDLGFSYEHQGKLQFLFGDTWARSDNGPIQKSTGGRQDDGFGSVDLARYRDPTAITPANIPLIKLGQNAGTTEMSAIDNGHVMDGGKTPLTGFSNGRREFGIFTTTKPKACRSDADCGGELECDAGLGFIGSRPSDEAGSTFGCVDGEPGCNSETATDAKGNALPGSGFCSDRTSTIWASTPAGRISAMALQGLVGIRSLDDARKYTDIQPWLTTRFISAIARTVNDFRPESISRQSHPDYRTARGSGSHQRVLLWGRPGFIGVGANKRTMGLYFAYVDMPDGPAFSWNVRYYTGTTAAGVPQFSSHERDAVALDLDSTIAGVQSAEIHDVTNQFSIAWIDPLKKWVMFYGGGMSTLPRPPFVRCGVLEVFAGRECKDVVVGNGAIHMRTADNPWGPWTPPQDVIVGGDPAVKPAGLYSVGGVLRHPACNSEGCATQSPTPFYLEEEYGFLYGANIIEQWIKPAGSGVDILWNASTWNPYRVVLLRTRIERR
jgi:hypothetical protein